MPGAQRGDHRIGAAHLFSRDVRAVSACQQLGTACRSGSVDLLVRGVALTVHGEQAVNGLHGEGGSRVSDVAGQERHQGAERVLVQPVLPTQPQVGGQAISGQALGSQGGDDGDAAFPPRESGVRPCGSPGGLEGPPRQTPARHARRRSRAPPARVLRVSWRTPKCHARACWRMKAVPHRRWSCHSSPVPFLVKGTEATGPVTLRARRTSSRRPAESIPVRTSPDAARSSALRPLRRSSPRSSPSLGVPRSRRAAAEGDGNNPRKNAKNNPYRSEPIDSSCEPARRLKSSAEATS